MAPLSAAPQSTEPPRAVVAVPVYNEEAHLAEALESLLGQTEPNLRVVVLDNRSTDATWRIAQEVARRDRRLTYLRGDAPVGLADNWRRAFWRARELHPCAPYFSWWGGHDTARPRWLETLAAELDADPSLVGAFATGVAHRTDGTSPKDLPTYGDTVDLQRTRERLKVLIPGEAIQGLMRVEALERTGVIRRVLLFDHFLMAELAAHGSIRHVPERLWDRRMEPRRPRGGTRARQRTRIFPEGVPLHGRLHPLVVHFTVLLWSLAVKGDGQPATGRREGLAGAVTFLYVDAARLARATTRRLRRRLDQRLRRLRRTGRKWVRRQGKRLRRIPRSLAPRP